MAKTPSLAGWYPDAGNPHHLRWWDGIGWTQHVRRAKPPSPIDGIYASPASYVPEGRTAPTPGGGPP